MERNEVKSIVLKELKKNSDVCTQIDEKDFFYNLGLNSLDAIEFCINLENAFKISIPDSVMEDLEKKSVKDIVDYIYEQIKMRL